MEEQIRAQIKKVDMVLVDSLVIPDYQRPYRWTEENVRLLLQDIYESWKTGKNSYRIGSIILYVSNDDKLNIVDGQQRVTTILLILRALGSSFGKRLCESLEYNHAESRNAIRKNTIFIEDWIKNNLNSEEKDFSKYLKKYCEFVEIKVWDLSQAFQMFDSQNGRGKELEAYNLLKAYHIRAMETNSFEEKIECDRNWENATRFKKNGGNINEESQDILKQIFNEQLYRTRIWSRKDEAWRFDKKKINEFKGITINKQNAISHSFQNRELLQYIVQNYFNSIGVDLKGLKSRFSNENLENVNPFVLINQNIINGKDFFEYIETYVEIYKQLFNVSKNDQFLIEFKSFYNKNCKQYDGANRVGDRYLRELYKSLIFMMFDRFGEEGVNKFYKTLFILVYRVRLEKKQVRYAYVAQYPVGKKIFHIVEKANSFVELQQLEQMAYKKIRCNKEVFGVLKLFSTMKIEVDTIDNEINLKKYNPSWN